MIIFFLLVLFVTQGVMAQTITRVYGYRTVTIPGNIPVVPPENGKGEPVVHDHAESYYIFVESNTGKAPVVKSVRINGALFRVLVQQQATPVVYEYFDGAEERRITLVPGKGKRVFSIILSGIFAGTRGKTGANELTVNYMNNGKMKMAVLKKIADLPVSVTQ